MGTGVFVELTSEQLASIGTGGQKVTDTAPPLLDYAFDAAPPQVNGIISADWWMRGKPGAMRGALYSHWLVYTQITSMMGKNTEFDVVCAPEPGNANQMNPSAYNSTVRHAWETSVGWVDTAPPREGSMPQAELERAWAEYYARFLERARKK